MLRGSDIFWGYDENFDQFRFPSSLHPLLAHLCPPISYVPMTVSFLSGDTINIPIYVVVLNNIKSAFDFPYQSKELLGKLYRI